MQFHFSNTPYFGFLIGIFGIILLALLLPEYMEIDANEISSGHAGQRVSVLGKIANLEIRNGNAFFLLENNSSIKAVFFSPSFEQSNFLIEGKIVKAKGRIELYKNEPELVVEEVKGIG